MKKILFVTLALAIVGGILAGCSGGGEAPKTDAPKTDAPKTDAK